MAATVRVTVQRQVAIQAVSDQYFVRPRDLRMLLAYIRAFGPSRVLRKVRSRQSETVRNDAWLSVGLGWTEIASERVAVAFVATGAPRGVERLTVPRLLVQPLETGAVPGGPPRHFVGGVDVKRDFGVETASELIALTGWQPEEGTEPAVSASSWQRVEGALRQPSVSWVEAPPRPPESEICERVAGGPTPLDRPTYHVFGYGQYAKVNAIANLDHRLHLGGIHEINPAQLGPAPLLPGPSLDTSPTLRPGEHIENAVLAGFHHSHAPLAVQLIETGTRHVVIEKPLATSYEQLEALLSAMDSHPEVRIHAAFQRRHAPFNKLVAKDLGSSGISMSATVYEVPLPARHWYRWPVVGNSVVSNGCHWIDYFLFVNAFAEVTRHEAIVMSNQIALILELETGASACISLRHEGSPRLGVRDLVTLWRDDVTVTITDNSQYRSERGYGRKRSARCGRLQSHEDMYREFARRIAHDDQGDSRRSIDISTRSMLRLAALVDASPQPSSRNSQPKGSRGLR